MEKFIVLVQDKKNKHEKFNRNWARPRSAPALSGYSSIAGNPRFGVLGRMAGATKAQLEDEPVAIAGAINA